MQNGGHCTINQFRFCMYMVHFLDFHCIVKMTQTYLCVENHCIYLVCSPFRFDVHLCLMGVSTIRSECIRTSLSFHQRGLSYIFYNVITSRVTLQSVVFDFLFFQSRLVAMMRFLAYEAQGHSCVLCCDKFSFTYCVNRIRGESVNVFVC